MVKEHRPLLEKILEERRNIEETTKKLEIHSRKEAIYKDQIAEKEKEISIFEDLVESTHHQLDKLNLNEKKL